MTKLTVREIFKSSTISSGLNAKFGTYSTTKDNQWLLFFSVAATDVKSVMPQLIRYFLFCVIRRSRNSIASDNLEVGLHRKSVTL